MLPGTTLNDLGRYGLGRKMVAHAGPDLIVCVSCGKLQIPNSGFAQCFFLYCVAACSIPLIVTIALEFDCQVGPAAMVYDKDIDALAVDRVKCVFITRSKNLAKTRLCKDPIAFARGCELVFDNRKNTIFRTAHHLLFLKGARHNGIQLLSNVCEIISLPTIKSENFEGAAIAGSLRFPKSAYCNQRNDNQQRDDDRQSRA